jgi:tRNA(Leu) C34 or U34 (ribose-2'-O)-methylase TrmL
MKCVASWRMCQLIVHPPNCIIRLLGNFGFEGACLMHVHTPLCPGTGGEATQQRLLRSSAMRLAGRNCDAKLTRQVVALDAFVDRIATWPRPIVVVETAHGAESIHSFGFPEHCDLLVGGEVRGVHPGILAALRPGIDSVIYVPMAGFAKSMNVAAATCVALYEHRRQHTCTA